MDFEKSHRDNKRQVSRRSDAGLSLTSQQSQPAGDKLRGRTNRVRHQNPIHQGLLTDYGITNARSANTSSSRSVRYDDRNLGANKAKDIPIRRIESKNETSQSLLQIFESELATAKASSQEPALHKLPLAHHRDIYQRNPLSTNRSANHTIHVQQLPQDLKRDPYPADILSNQGDICAPIHQAVDDIGKVLLELQKLASTPEENRSSGIIREALQLGLFSALQSLGACMQNISDTVQHCLVDSSTEELQKLLTAIRCSARKPPVHFLPKMGLERDLKSQQLHDQVSFGLGRSLVTRERIPPKDCLSTHTRLSDPSDCLGARSSVDASANSIDPQTMPSRPSSRESLVADIAQETAGEMVIPTLVNNPEWGEGQGRDVIWRTQEVHDSPGTTLSADGLHHKTSKATNGASNILYKLPETSHMDAPLGLSCESISEHSRFPPLPTMEPLIPYKEADPSNSHCMSDGNRKSSDPAAFRDRDCPNPRSIGPVAPEEPRVINALPKSVQVIESSGQFFDRMTGRSTEHSTFHGQDQALSDGIQRNATVDGSSSCGPHTIRSSGNIRIPWSSIAQRSQIPPRGWERLRTIENNTRPEETTGDGRCVNHSQRSGMLADMAYAVDHSDAATAGKIQECVEQLQILGFDHDTPGALGRLVVYAQAAEGELSSAIDMIDEEQRAYNQRQ